MRLFFIGVALFFSTFTFGQSLRMSSLVDGFDKNGKVEGVIYDGGNNNEPLFFAEVIVKETNTTVTTNKNGNFKINLKPGNFTLKVSFIGYKTAEITNVHIEANTKLVLNQVLVPLKIERFDSEAIFDSKTK